MKKITKKSEPPTIRESPISPKPKNDRPKPSRELIHRFRGKYKGAGLLEELMEEKKREREL